MSNPSTDYFMFIVFCDMATKLVILDLCGSPVGRRNQGWRVFNVWQVSGLQSWSVCQDGG